MSDDAVRQAIVRAAQAHGIDPATALAIADRESKFDPNAKASKTIRGIFQMTGQLRRQYGIGDSTDPDVQANGWAQFYNDNKGEMARTLGRAPTDAEGYYGHYWGATRAARMMQMAPGTGVDSIFTPSEIAQNPDIGKAKNVGTLLRNVGFDIKQGAAKYAGATAGPDLSEFGSPVEEAGAVSAPPKAPDLSAFGTVAADSSAPTPAPPAADLSQYGTPA